jgi:hypothetical protein
VSEFKANVEAVYRRLEAAASRGGRKAGDVTLIAVSKTHPAERVIEAYQAGLRHFGENRTLEQEKVAVVNQWVASQAGAARPTWHFIGNVQSRQVGDVLGHYDLIHSVDSLKLAQRINRLAERDGLPAVEILLQGNVSGETAKSGFDLSHWSSRPEKLAVFLATIAEMATLEKIKIRGLMTMAPIVTDPEETRPTFSSLAALRQRLQQERPDLEWAELSMGMTDDFEVAIEEGATLIRVGRALFGER